MTVNERREVYSGPGTPEAKIPANAGDVYICSDGAIYHKEKGSGTTGWVLLPITVAQVTATLLTGTQAEIAGFRVMSKAGVPGAGDGVTIADPGSLCIDTTGADLYINAGTAAVPSWKKVTRAA